MMPEQVARGRQFAKPEKSKAKRGGAAATMTATTVGRPTPIQERNPLIEEWIMETCVKCGYPELSARLSYEISTNTFFNDHGGYASTFFDGKGRVERGIVQFSRVYWTLPRQLNAYRKNLVIHETCHVIANHIAGRDVQHEQPWKQMMHLCGQPSWTNVFTP